MKDKYSKAPDKNTTQWRKNEKIINQNKVLKSARDKVEGFSKTSMITTGVNDEQYKAGYDQIKWNTDNTVKKSYKVKINGRYVDEEEDKQ